MEFNQLGNMANNANGKANATENPNIPKSGPTGILPKMVAPPPVAVSTNKVPIIGPVQENETSVSVNAMKNIPINPLRSAILSDLFAHELGSVISKYPKKDMAKTMNNIAKPILNQALVDKRFNASAPNTPVISKPRIRYINMIDKP